MKRQMDLRRQIANSETGIGSCFGVCGFGVWDFSGHGMVPDLSCYAAASSTERKTFEICATTSWYSRAWRVSSVRGYGSGTLNSV